MKKGLIFDMDGTLWDSAQNVAKAWDEIVKKNGYADHGITTEDVKSVMGLTMDRIADRLFDYLEKEKRMQLLNECCAAENDYLRTHGGILYPQLVETLEKLRAQGYHLYIVSNCQKGYIEAFLEHYGFGYLFDDIECYGNNLKEKGDNIALVAGRNHLDKAYYVGDIQGDYDASSKAGTAFIHAAYGFGSVRQDVPRIEKLADLTELMMRLEPSPEL